MLKRIKTLLGFKDDTNDELLNEILELTTERFLFLIGEEEIPYRLQYIVIEVVMARFNKIGSEGLNSHSVEGESMSFVDDDFEPFRQDIKSYLATQGKGRVMFL